MIKATASSLFLAILFFVVYGGSNYLASMRADVGSAYGQWEQAIPFVPLMIVPYMSIDLFFVAAPFLCRREKELRALVRQVAMAILVCGAFFVVAPLSFAFERPAASGWLGVIF